MQSILQNLPHYIYQRGADIFSDLMWEIAEKKPRIRQFVLTSSDYCKLYVTVISFHTRRASASVPLDCGEEYVYVPVSFGLISRTPYLTFPKIFLSHVYHSVTVYPADSRAVLVRSLAQLVHGVPVPASPSSLSLWNLPGLPNSKNELLLYMGDCGIEKSTESRPVPSSLKRGFSEVDLIALFDILSLDSILFTLNAILLEQKILLISSRWSSSFISHLCESLRVLMYPFDWHHVFIPLIPAVSLEDLSGDSQLPFWIDSAMSTDHVHPLRFLDVPAPLLGGLRIKSKAPVHGNLKHRFRDLNLVDLDNDVVYPSDERVDRVNAPLPPFPRKLGQLIALRLSSLGEKLCVGGRPPSPTDLLAKERLERYARWEEVLPLELFVGRRAVPSSHSPNEDSASPASQTSSSVLVNSFRRRSLVRTSTYASARSQFQTQSKTWLGAFTSFFRASGHHHEDPRPRRLSSSETLVPPRTESIDAPSPSTSEPDIDLESEGSRLIQSALLEAFVKLFFAYKEFLFVQTAPPRTFSGSSVSLSPFVGWDRSFHATQFVKCAERNTTLGSEATGFIKAFFSTQCWDIFIRTTALLPICTVFDAACGLFAICNKVDYLKYKQFLSATSTAVSCTETHAVTPQRVLDECERMKPCPIGKKAKDHFFAQLVAFIARQRLVDSVTYCEEPTFSLLSHSPTSAADVVATIAQVVSKDLPQLFRDPNEEANKLASLHDHKKFAFSDIVNLKLAWSHVEAKRMEMHLLHAVLNLLTSHGLSGSHSGIATASPQGSESPVTVMSQTGSQSGGSGTAPFSPIDDSVSLWSHHSRPVPRNGTFGGQDDLKLLGGISKTALQVRVPQVPLSLIRGESETRETRLLFRITDVSRIDFHCTHCGCWSSLSQTLSEAEYGESILESRDDEATPSYVHSTCRNCDTHFFPLIVGSSESLGSCRILKLANLVDQLSVFPITASTYLNLSLVLGIEAEVYSHSASRRELKGVIPFIDILADFLGSTVGINKFDEEPVATSPHALAVVPSPSRSISSDDGGIHDKPESPVKGDGDSENSSGESRMPGTPRSRAVWRVKQYRKILREKEQKRKDEEDRLTEMTRPGLGILTTPVLRVHVDSPSKPSPPPVTAERIRRRISSNRRHSPPVVIRPTTPEPPSDKKPEDAAPRRTRRSGGQD